MPHGKVTVIPKGRECEVEWELNFFSILKEIDVSYSSPDLSFEGESWCLLIRRNGCRGRSDGHIACLHLFRSSIGPPMVVEFTFALKAMYGMKFLLWRTEDFACCSCCYGSAKLPFIFDTEESQSAHLAYNDLTMVCTLKRLNSRVNPCNIAAPSSFYCEKTSDTRKRPSLQKKYGVNCPDPLQNCDENKYKKSRTEAVTNTPKSLVDPPHDKFQKDFKQLFLKQELCDVVLRVEGREFQAHKAVLGARSPVFLSTFRNDMKEKKTGTVDIEDCDPSIFSDFLCFLYSDDLDNLSGQNVFGLFTVADKYDIPDLRGKCLEFMKKNLSVDKFCETMTLALQHKEAELIHAATDFFIKNAKEILVTVKWQSFASKNFTLSNELVIKFVESVKGPNT